MNLDNLDPIQDESIIDSVFAQSKEALTRHLNFRKTNLPKWQDLKKEIEASGHVFRNLYDMGETNPYDDLAFMLLLIILYKKENLNAKKIHQKD